MLLAQQLQNIQERLENIARFLGTTKNQNEGKISLGSSILFFVLPKKPRPYASLVSKLF